MSLMSGPVASFELQNVASADLPYLAGGGDMGALIRAYDWAKGPLGPPEGWSQSLKMMVSFLLANRFPLLLWWGPQYVQLYNDSYRPCWGPNIQHRWDNPAASAGTRSGTS